MTRKDPQPIHRVLAFYGIQQATIARRIGVSAQVTGRWLRGRERCPDARRDQLAAALSELVGAPFTVAELFHDDHDQENIHVRID